MSLRDLELVYDQTLNKWVYVDKNDDTIILSNKKIIANRYLRNGFYPQEYSFLQRKKMDKIQCSYCGTFIPVKVITRDHVYPKSLGGTYVTPACDACNTLKKNMKPIEWAIEASQSGLSFDKHMISEQYALLVGKEGNEDAYT